MIATEQDIIGMRAAGQLAARLLNFLAQHVKPGISTGDLDSLAAEWTKKSSAISAPLNYVSGHNSPFPASICTSVNDVVCHGIPKSTQTLINGDIVNVDVTPILNGYHGDTSKTFAVGKASAADLDLISATEECLKVGIDAARPGQYLGTIGHLIEQAANKRGYHIVREFVGHGIGKKFHTQPYVAHYGRPNTGLRLLPGMIFTIEPILIFKDPAIKFINDWEAISVGGHRSAQAEHTILITDNKPEILTMIPE